MERLFVQINHRVYKLILVGLFHSLLRGRCSGIITQHASCNTQWWWRKRGGGGLRGGNSGEPGGTDPSAPPLDLWVFLLLVWRQNSSKKESHNTIQLRVFKIYYSKNYSNYFRRSIGNSACLLRQAKQHKCSSRIPFHVQLKIKLNISTHLYRREDSTQLDTDWWWRLSTVKSCYVQTWSAFKGNNT